MPKVLLHVVCETQGDQLRMKDGFDLVTVLGVRRIGPDLQWSLVVSREVADEIEDYE